MITIVKLGTHRSPYLDSSYIDKHSHFTQNIGGYIRTAHQRLKHRPSSKLEGSCGIVGAIASRELELPRGGFRSNGLILFFCAEVAFDDVKGFLVDLTILVGLQELYLVQAVAFLSHDSVGVGGLPLLALNLPQSQDVLQAGEGHLHNLAVHDSQQVTQWRDALLVHQEPDLFRRTPRCGISNGPGSFLSSFEFCLTKNINEHREYVAVYHTLNLLSVSSSDV